MDERSPRQPDSSGPLPGSGEPPRPGTRPENPYRIPQPSDSARPTGAGGPGYAQPRPADPAPSVPTTPPRAWDPRPDADEPSAGSGAFAAPEPPQAFGGPGPGEYGTPRPQEPAGPGAYGDPGEHAAPAPPPGPGAYGNPGAYGGPGQHDAPPQYGDSQADDAWEVPVPAASGPDGSLPAHESWSAPSQEEGPDAGGWDDPYPGQSAHQGETPYPGGAPRPYDEPGPYDERGPEGRGHEHAAAGEPADGFEYLYGGPGGPDGPGGPGGPGGPDGPDDYGHQGFPPGPPARKSRRGLIIGVLSAVVVLLLIGGGVSWYVLTMPEPGEATAEYAAAWNGQDYERMAAVTTGDDPAAILGGIDTGLGVEGVNVAVAEPTADGDTGSAAYEVTVSLANADDWGWEGELPLVRQDGEWLVEFSAETAYPGLGEGQVLARTTVWGERGQILAADGSRLDEASGSLQMIAGTMGEATEEDVERLGPAYKVGDTIGASGLQRTYEERLAGEAATTIVMVDAEQAEDPDSVEATEENTVTTLDGSDGEDIVTSIDMGVQNAAANAVIDSSDDVGMVAVRPSTGEILALANVPGGFNRAFEGQYPPGSAFKIITYSSLLDNGMTTDTAMDCPKEYNLGGWDFVNAGEGEYGAQTVTEAFATSCNTALVDQVGQRLSSDALQASAEQFGMNAPMDIGVDALDPSFPAVDSDTMLGAQSIGQGQVLTSPLHMATVPAAIADGSWRHPVLVTEPAAEGLPEPTPIPQAEAIRPMMRSVITDGTAKDAGFQGEVYGKTGSAEFGTPEGDDDELPTHAWMVGYKGDVAFAIVVEGGGGGGSVAGPLAAAFTNAL
ncbi:cell division protein FtsI/penicillin-binding protein 2 [Nocardiopsis sp. Huas11]|uniref:penicillin-binding transpeptidase domain-containing protein n=1 Tax=Nocardiopsis sp. Huas11 TaxID=2183912 RepID=UPI000EB25CB5|nr:penicillin-binding transpeptidase domain-containing protein [Nocardiopsis sp. Huas11]RKS08280.1 cell division protein FtsI/penicillin-binding protein 2 [Nocardiopsis sp. Huas11]